MCNLKVKILFDFTNFCWCYLIKTSQKRFASQLFVAFCYEHPLAFCYKYLTFKRSGQNQLWPDFFLNYVNQGIVV